MANDREVHMQVWQGKIPAKFIVPDENDQDAFYLMLPRVSYLAIVSDKVKKHFQRFIQKEDEVWFSWNEIPLKFHLPIGKTLIFFVHDDSF